MGNKFSKRRIAIIGANNGVGGILAGWLAEEGAQIYTTSRISGGDGEANFNGDLTDPHVLDSLIRELVSFNPDTVLHCLGGGLGLRDDLISKQDFNSLLDINFLVSLQINNALIPNMEVANRGWIIHFGSVAAREATASVGYSCVKAIIPAYVKSVGRRLLPRGIFVSGLCLGAVSGNNGAMDRLKARSPDIHSDFIQKRRPSGRVTPVSTLLPFLTLLMTEDAIVHASNMMILDEGECIAI